MKHFNSIRELFWPLLTNDENEEKPSFKQESESVNAENLDKALELMLKIYASEDERSKNVESKASLFIGTISVLTTIAVGFTTILIKEGTFKTSLFLLLLLLFVLTIYLVRTVWFAVKALERKNYFSLSANDFLNPAAGEAYTRQIISSVAVVLKKNEETINDKVNNMVMAQEYFKRAIVVVGIYAFSLIMFYFFQSNWVHCY
jgi:hypothetical protein